MPGDVVGTDVAMCGQSVDVDDGTDIELTFTTRERVR
jgi:hypothetical protein